ncbi:MAG: Crp/Fnr family transcriptional regulator [Oscillibacter sp.]|nr:Crp/Fnr family transcriptional regulator [Oscillibacter sp.]
MRYAELLELAPGLREFTAQIPEDLDGQFQLKTHPAHTLIHQKDSPLERIGILLRGTFRVVNEFENGNVFMIEMNEAVSFIGEVTLLAEAAATSVTIETVTDCLVASLPVECFDAWLRQDIVLLRGISRHVAAKLYCSSYSRGERLFHSAKYVLLKYLVHQAEVQGIQAGRQVVLSKTRQQISEEVGLTVKTINRTLTQFVKDGILSIQRGKASFSAGQYHRAQRELRVYMSQSKNGAFT